MPQKINSDFAMAVSLLANTEFLGAKYAIDDINSKILNYIN